VADYAPWVGICPPVPLDSLGKREPRDGFVVAPKQEADLEQRSVGSDVGAGAVGYVPGHVGEDLAPLSVDVQHAWGTIEAHPLEVAQ
jgi:hypothetical protein